MIPSARCRQGWFRPSVLLSFLTLGLFFGLTAGCRSSTGGEAASTEPASAQTAAALALTQAAEPPPTATLSVSEVLAGWPGSMFTDGIHRDSGLECGDCHQQLPPAGGSQGAVCLDCHGSGSVFGMTAETSDYEPNPHDLHYGPIDCTFCHRMHEEQGPACSFCHSDVAINRLGGEG